MTRMNERVESVRRFNRFYTRSIDVLPEGHLQSPHSLAEVRVLYEVAHRDDATAAEIASDLGFDAGYLSRILRRFEEQGILTRTRSRADARQSHLALTKKGRATFATLETRARHDIGSLLDALTEDEQHRVTSAMGTIERLLDRRSASPSSAPLILRDPRRLPPDRSQGAAQPHRRPPHLRPRRLPPHRRGTEREFREKARLGNVGAGAEVTQVLATPSRSA